MTTTEEMEMPVVVKNLSFSYSSKSLYDNSESFLPVLKTINLQVLKGTRLLLVGANGSGKSTLLRILAGKHLHQENTVFLFGRNAFRDTTLNHCRSYVGTDWGQTTIGFCGQMALSADIPVHSMMKALQLEFPDRRKALLQVLRIDPNWRMHKLSDGQRRRIQLFLSLLRPTQLILLDEVVAVLDVIARQDLLKFLKEESEAGVTILFASNVFEGMDDWATRIVYLRNGEIGYDGTLFDIPYYSSFIKRGVPSPLMKTVEAWIREEMKENVQNQEKEAGQLHDTVLNNPQKSAGGFASGRLSDLPFI